MKSLPFASFFAGAASTALVFVGPIHYAVTKPCSLYVLVPANPVNSMGTRVVPVGRPALDFVVTDVVLGRAWGSVMQIDLRLNGTPVFALPSYDLTTPLQSAHLTSGFLVPGGANIDLQISDTGSSGSFPVTLVGYNQ